LKPIDEIKSLFEQAGVNLHKPTIFSCGRCIGACVLKTAAEQLGIDQSEWFLYDGSMNEYNDKTGVVVNH
jgi:thiosulfate/3-mercaptopyruvate sulfurtransferase